jgi:glutaredoxin
LLSDFWPHGQVAEKFGVLRSDGTSERAIFVIDSDGIICYIDIHDIDEQPSNDVLISVLRRIDPQAARNAPVEEKFAPGDLPTSGIVLYCTSWCPACRRARNWLEQNQLEYTEINITQNRAAAAQVREWANGYETTPTFDIDGVIVVNFNEEKLREALKERLKE